MGYTPDMEGKVLLLKEDAFQTWGPDMYRIDLKAFSLRTNFLGTGNYRESF